MLDSLLYKIQISFKFYLTNLGLLKRPLNVYWNNFNQKISNSVSDSFVWRTDSDFITKFHFTDLIGVFYEKSNSVLEIVIYSSENINIKTIEIENKALTNKFEINEELIGYKGHGYFFVFHRLKTENHKNIQIFNSCYTSFHNNHGGSFVHGNSIVMSKGVFSDETSKNFVNNSFLKNQNYHIQNDFSEFDKVELVFNNPRSDKINFEVNSTKFSLSPYCSVKVELSKINKIKIKSNCRFLRPLIFIFKGKYFDVYHS